MSIASCSGQWTLNAEGALLCSGDVTSVDPVQVAIAQRDALLLTSSDMAQVVAACVGIFVIGFAVKLIRNTMNV